MESEMELWKDIAEYEGLYQVSNFGNVKALERIILNKNGNLQRYPEKLLKPDVYKTTHTNYLRVTLCKQHQTKKHSVHRLVAEAFIPNIGNKPFVNHIDNNAENNNSSNLEWCTHEENMLHAQRQGRLYASQSKGGSIGGAVGKQRRLNKAKALMNTNVGDWFIPVQEPSLRGMKMYLKCTCQCGTQELVEMSRLDRKETTNCRACGQRHRRR